MAKEPPRRCAVAQVKPQQTPLQTVLAHAPVRPPTSQAAARAPLFRPRSGTPQARSAALCCSAVKGLRAALTTAAGGSGRSRVRMRRPLRRTRCARPPHAPRLSPTTAAGCVPTWTRWRPVIHSRHGHHPPAHARDTPDAASPLLFQSQHSMPYTWAWIREGACTCRDWEPPLHIMRGTRARAASDNIKIARTFTHVCLAEQWRSAPVAPWPRTHGNAFAGGAAPSDCATSAPALTRPSTTAASDLSAASHGLAADKAPSGPPWPCRMRACDLPHASPRRTG